MTQKRQVQEKSVCASSLNVGMYRKIPSKLNGCWVESSSVEKSTCERAVSGTVLAKRATPIVARAKQFGGLTTADHL